MTRKEGNRPPLFLKEVSNVKIQSLRTDTAATYEKVKFKKYKKLQSLRTIYINVFARSGSKNTTNYNP